jgi:hypothetical protein
MDKIHRQLIDGKTAELVQAQARSRAEPAEEESDENHA